MPTIPFLAFRAVLHVVNEEGATVEVATRDYIRGDWHVGTDRFRSYVLGDMVRVVGVQFDHGARIADLHAIEIDFETVRENRKYQHTTHGTVSE